MTPEAMGAARAIQGWLLHSGVQLADGPERGGVAGWLDRRGRPEFVYAEITGYYLVYTAWLLGGAREGVRAVGSAGHAAIRWLASALADGRMPPTRLDLGEPRGDWRNTATFTFDVAMAARGAGCFAQTAGDDAAAEVARALSARLRQLAANVAPLRSHVALGAAEPPPRWSTRPGPHHVKAAAAVLRLPAGTADDALRRVCAETAAHWSEALRSSWAWGDLHPLLYCLEGEALLDACGVAGPRAELADAYERVLSHQRADGGLPGSLAAGDRPARADVLAQGLRMGAILRAHGELKGEAWRRRLDALAGALLAHVHRDGSVAFHRGDGRGNAWAAMFAHQALVDYVAVAAARPLPEAAIRLLV